METLAGGPTRAMVRRTTEASAPGQQRQDVQAGTLGSDLKGIGMDFLPAAALPAPPRDPPMKGKVQALNRSSQAAPVWRGSLGPGTFRSGLPRF